ncbi:MAG: hypothetical protein IT473_12860 [Lysobacter sp.]|nr:hypothetical protein [Lysobacter sp.]
MANVYLLAGFNNWGKTHLITKLFNKGKFSKSIPAMLEERQFCVVPQSNDDLGESGFIRAYQERIKALEGNNYSVTHVAAAFCPTKEKRNDSLNILNKLFAKDKVFLIPIEYKWCGHAKLQISDIAQYYSQISNMTIHPLSQKDPAKVASDLKRLIAPLL